VQKTYLDISFYQKQTKEIGKKHKEQIHITTGIIA